ncbi:MAG: hypothetical protein DI626_08615 [Micavibrio aeruginosavorus]|uniref:Flippase-like domain-containing protein n=1 Tax=Micavibrio aeruginosavorus TaxID=349221 RepID=A0A2W5BLG8_9BACT|nr:MAG: hypothetical protein DI626_08615 [Micavibrio aeruginosavorus]
MNKLKNYGILIKILISVTILAALVMRMDFHALSDFGAHFKLGAWVQAIIFIMLQNVFLGMRWRMLVNTGKKYLSVKEAMRMQFASQLGNLLFITSIGGVAARIALAMRSGVSFLKAVIASLFDRALTLAALIILAVAFIPAPGEYTNNRTVEHAMLVSAVLFIILVVGPLFLNFVIFRMVFVKRLKGKMRYCVRYAKILLRSPIRLARIVLVSLIAQICFFLSILSLTSAYGIELSFDKIMSVLPLITLVSSLPVSIGGWGVREGAFVYGYGLLGIKAETAFLISIQVGLTGVLAIALLGLPAILSYDFKIRKFMPTFLNRANKNSA